MSTAPHPIVACAVVLLAVAPLALGVRLVGLVGAPVFVASAGWWLVVALPAGLGLATAAGVLWSAHGRSPRRPGFTNAALGAFAVGILAGVWLQLVTLFVTQAS